MPLRIEHEFLGPDPELKRYRRVPPRLVVRALDGKLVVGTVTFEVLKKLHPIRVDVLAEFRRQGIATMMYRHAEVAAGKTIQRSTDQSDYGRALWKKSREQRGFGYMRVPGRR